MRKAFTLIEAIMVIVIAAIIALIIALYIREGFEAWRFLSGQKSIALSTRAAVNRVVRELKRAKKNKNITTRTPKTVTFLDIDNSTITFSQEGTALFRNSNILLDNLQDPCGLSLLYLDKDGNETSVTSEVQVVRIRITTLKNENKFVIESAARIRVKKL